MFLPTPYPPPKEGAGKRTSHGVASGTPSIGGGLKEVGKKIQHKKKNGPVCIP